MDTAPFNMVCKFIKVIAGTQSVLFVIEKLDIEVHTISIKYCTRHSFSKTLGGHLDCKLK